MVQRWLAALGRLASLPQLPDILTNESLARADYDTASSALLAFRSVPDLSRQWLLDLGCGLGGKSVYYAERGAYMVVGLDMSEERARIAYSFAKQRSAGTVVQLVVGDAAHLPFPSSSFDCVISTDAWEHLQSPLLSLRECMRMVRAGGTVHINALPYFSPWGAHAWPWLPLPWIQVVLPRRYLFSLISMVERHRQINPDRPAAVRLDWSHPNDLGHAQRLTIRSLSHDLSNSDITPLCFTVIPIGSHFGSNMAKLGQTLIRLPLLREVLAGTIVIEIRKPVIYD
jgi:SAM-dependent methyltransferase